MKYQIFLSFGCFLVLCGSAQADQRAGGKRNHSLGEASAAQDSGAGRTQTLYIQNSISSSGGSSFEGVIFKGDATNSMLPVPVSPKPLPPHVTNPFGKDHL